MKKLGAILFILILALAFAVAQDNETNSDEEDSTNQVDLAYQCLEDQIDSKEQSALSLQDAIFSTLALGSNSKLEGVISDQKGDNCWPKSSCNLKETSQVLISKNRLNEDTDEIEEWIRSNEKTPTDLTWYLQIDISSHESASCDITYDDNDYSINVNDDMTLGGSTGSCLFISPNGYWLQVNNNCADKIFEISCDKDFVTSLLYQRTGSSSYFVSPDTHSASALGTTEEAINSKCFSTQGNCDYEGTLWAALSIENLAEDSSPYLPYLLALAETNQKYFPSTFLYMMTNGNDQYNEIIQSQQQGKYWQAPTTPYNRFYDTSLAMLALIGSSASTELSSAKSYLLDTQTTENCWNNNNIRDTAFVLYSGWPRQISGNTNTPSPTETCESQGYYCVSGYSACINAGGSTQNYACEGIPICCSAEPSVESCAQQSGEVCTAGQICSGTTTQASDGSCCLGTCQTEVTTESECSSQGGICDSSCKSYETESTLSCDIDTEVCCVTKESSGNLWVWIIILIILIALVGLAIIYRKKLQLIIYKLKKKKGSSSSSAISGRRPPFPPAVGGTRIPIKKQIPRRVNVEGMSRKPMSTRKVSRTDKDFEDTLRKLKDMSK